jgi:hypothetical protein
MKSWLALLFGLGLLLTPLATQAAETYCVGAGNECGRPEIVRQHRRWHSHSYVTDGKDCYQCYDERDDTCDTSFIPKNPGWRSVGLAACLVIGPASTDKGVITHVIGGKEVTKPKPKKPPPKKKVTLTPEVYRRTPGPYAVGDSVTFDVRVRGKGKDARAFTGGELVVTNKQGEEVARVPVRVKGGSAKTAKATVKVPAGDLFVQFVPKSPTVRSDEVLGKLNSPKMALKVGSCPLRGRLEDRDTVVLVGETLGVVGDLRTHTGSPAQASELAGARVELLLQLDGGLETRFPAQLDGNKITGSIKAPDIDDLSAKGTISVVSSGTPLVCPGGSQKITVSRTAFTLNAEAPEQCWTGQECAATFTIGVGSGPAAAKARALLSQPELEVIAKIGGDRVAFDGTPAGGTITVRTTPQKEGRVTFSLELVSPGESVAAEAQSDVAEAITVRLPEELDLGQVGPGDLESTCQPLDFSASNGAMGARFSIDLADPCPDCEAHVVTVAGGQRADLPLVVTIGRDQVLPICLMVGRCPTGEAGGDQVLVVNPLEARFAGQQKRVRVRYTVAGKGSFQCWGWMLWWVLGGIVLVLIWYGFHKPVGFPPGVSILLASDQKKLRRAAKVLLEDQPGGRKGWYRSAKVHFDGSGGATPRRSEASFTLVPFGGGVGIIASGGLLRQDKRTRKMEPAEPLPGDKAVGLSRGREYEAGGLVLKLG